MTMFIGLVWIGMQLDSQLATLPAKKLEDTVSESHKGLVSV